MALANRSRQSLCQVPRASCHAATDPGLASLAFESAQYAGAAPCSFAVRASSARARRRRSRSGGLFGDLRPRRGAGVHAVIHAGGMLRASSCARRARDVGRVARRHGAIDEHRYRLAGADPLDDRAEAALRRPLRRRAAEQALDPQHVRRASTQRRTTRRAASRRRRHSADPARPPRCTGDRSRRRRRSRCCSGPALRRLARRALASASAANALTCSASAG